MCYFLMFLLPKELCDMVHTMSQCIQNSIKIGNFVLLPGYSPLPCAFW